MQAKYADVLKVEELKRYIASLPKGSLRSAAREPIGRLGHGPPARQAKKNGSVARANLLASARSAREPAAKPRFRRWPVSYTAPLASCVRELQSGCKRLPCAPSLKKVRANYSRKVMVEGKGFDPTRARR